MAQTLVDIRQPLLGFAKMSRRAAQDTALFFAELKTEAKAEIRSHRRGLAKRDKDTVASHGKGRILGKVLTAYKTRTDSSGLYMRSQIAYSGVLDQGGVVGRGSKLPARTYAYWSNPFLTTVKERYAAFAVRLGWG